MQQDIVNIIEEVKSGNRMAFKYLVEEHQQYAFNIAFKVLCNEEDAKDVVQESFIKVWKNINSFNVKMKFTTWMYKIVINNAIDKLRSTRRMKMFNIENASESLYHVEKLSPDVQLENSELGNIINLISEELPEKQRLVFVLRDIQGFDSDDVEKFLAMTSTSVKSNLYNARKLVRKKLAKLFVYERGDV